MVRWFGNDGDGISLPDFVGAIVFIIWTIITVWMVIKLFSGNLTEIMVDFYSIFCWVPLGVIGGLFGGNIIDKVGARYTKRSSTTYHNNGEYIRNDYNEPSI